MAVVRTPLQHITVAWPRFVAIFVLVGVGTAMLTGVPTDLVPNDWFTRMTPVQSYGYPVWAATAALSGLLAASYWGVAAATCSTARGGALGGVGAGLSWLAIGCPVCNKLVVGAIGASGAMTYFAPVQPWLAGLSLGTLLLAIGWRWSRLLGTPVPQGSEGLAAAGRP